MSTFDKHPHFDLWLHSTESLADVIGRPINHRETVHDWPLSTVQKLSCGDGRELIYKSQAQPTVEPEFYQLAQSSLLPAHQYLGEVNGCHTMVFDYINGKRVCELPLSVSQTLELSRKIQNEIALIQGNVPAYIDIGSVENWLAFAESTVEAIAELTKRQVFNTIPLEALSSLHEWATRPTIRDLVKTTSAFTHGDLTGENIFMVGDQLRLIDWQRPRVAPKEVDRVTLLYAQGIDPYLYINHEAVQMFHFLKIGWFVECQTTHFPQGSTYEQQILDEVPKVLTPQ